MSESSFTLNGQPVDASGADPHCSVLNFLRARGLTGTKEGCAEGECGACAVVLVQAGPDGKSRYKAVNSCLLLVGAVLGQELISVEGVATGGELHPVQKAMVELGGSQCGYCTPGFVMSMFAEYYRPGRDGFDPDSIAGNLCRCTGYRPIRDATSGLAQPAAGDPHLVRLRRPAPQLNAAKLGQNGQRLHRPTSLADLFTLRASHPDAVLVAGGTDVVVDINLKHARFEALIALEGVSELRGFESSDTGVEIGAALTLAEVEERLHSELPVLAQGLLPLFSSRLIRNRATFGGNLVTASPIGDGAPLLLALGASVRLQGPRGKREVPLAEFFTAYRKTALLPDEVLVSVLIPKPFPAFARFYKVSKRVHDDISTVAGAFALDRDASGKVSCIRLGFGGVAATPARALAAEQALLGQAWDAATIERTKPILQECFSPIDDHRGSARYRRQVVPKLLEKFFHESQEQES